MKELSCVFVIPHLAGAFEGHLEKKIVAETIDGIFSQTDDNWYVIMVVDLYPKREVRNYLNYLTDKYHGKIDVIYLEQDVGPGVCRNVGVFKAVHQGHSVVLFNDSDDISHPKRVEVVKKILEDPDIDVVYSTFEVIDENGNLMPAENICSPILEILESHKENHLEGYNVWMEMGTVTGITNITSSTAVRMDYAYQCPFPNEKASEDFHCWMRMSAIGANFRYTPVIPSKYRIPSFMKYQASRTRLGPSNFNKIKTCVDIDAFSKAAELAILRKKIKPEELPMLKSKFYRRLAKSMTQQMEVELAQELLEKAIEMENESLSYSRILDL